jgi:hypothetical protein
MRVLKACRSSECGRAAPDSDAKAVGKPCNTVRCASTTPVLTKASERHRDGAAGLAWGGVETEGEKSMKGRVETGRASFQCKSGLLAITLRAQKEGKCQP